MRFKEPDVSTLARSGYTADMQKMTPKDASAWRDRWRAVNAHRVAEVRAMTVDEKADQLDDLMSANVAAKWIRKREVEVEIIRRRWARLREVYGCLE